MVKKIMGIGFVFYLLLLLSFVIWSIQQRSTYKPPAPKPLPDFSLYSSPEEKKQAFFDYLSPLVEYENSKIEKKRRLLLAFLQQLPPDNALSKHQQHTLHKWAKRWKVKTEQPTEKIIESLQRRVDTLPAAMVLAQAANESAWGKSRFARKANNLFGEWCYSSGCGLVPKKRRLGATHEVRKFDTVEASVASYMRNINTHRAYRGVRDIRRQLRQQSQEVTALALIEGLEKYSQRGEHYIEELKSMIRANGLE